MSTANGRSRTLPEPIPVTLDDLIIPVEGLDVDALLAEWRWLVDDRYRPLFLTALGDLFLEGPGGTISLLRTGAAQLVTVAGSRDEFDELMAQPEKVQEWFAPELVGTLKAQGLERGPEQCYGYMNPPCLGGRNEPLNLEPADLYVHFSILGQIASQISDVPATTGGSPRQEENDV
jgi:hypothetical protein